MQKRKAPKQGGGSFRVLMKRNKLKKASELEPGDVINDGNACWMISCRLYELSKEPHVFRVSAYRYHDGGSKPELVHFDLEAEKVYNVEEITFKA